MVIKIKAENHKLTIPIPNGLVFNGLTAKIVSGLNDVPLTKEQFNILFHELKRAKQILGDTPLIDIKSNKNESVCIKL